jgi:hypothetical protein
LYLICNRNVRSGFFADSAKAEISFAIIAHQSNSFFMKKKLIRSSVLLLVLCMNFSCHKTGVETVAEKSLRDFSLPAPPDNRWAAARNPANPYDAVGYYHNDLMQRLDKKVDLFVGTETLLLRSANSTGTKRINFFNEQDVPAEILETLYQETATYMGQTFGNDVRTAFVQSIPLETVEPPVVTAYTTDIQSLNASDEAKNYLTSMQNLLTDTLNSSVAGDYEQCRNAIIAIEDNILYDNAISPQEKAQLLAAGSTLRHSLLYWRDVDAELFPGENNFENFRRGLNPVNQHNFIGVNRAKGFLKWLGWALVGAADAMGAYIGANFSGVGGAIAMGALGSGAAYFIFRERGW